MLRLVLFASTIGNCAWTSASAQEKPTVEAKKPQQIIDGQLTGFDMPVDWKISERVRNLTFTNPFNQNVAARWVNGEIVYRISLGELNVDPKTTKVAKEYITVYAPRPAIGLRRWSGCRTN